MFSSSKNGQVTIFIIIGIILLFTFAGIMYFTSNTISEKISSEGEPVIQNAPSEFSAIQTFTQDCISQISEQAISILGEQGGYIYPDLLGEFPIINPTDQIGLNLNSIKVPYWHFNSQPNKANLVSFESRMPQLIGDEELSIESQIKRFLSENINTCLNDYQTFTQTGFSIEKDNEDEYKLIFSDEFVGVEMNTNIKVSRGQTSSDLDKFYVRIPVQLKKTYETAKQINDAQQEFLFLERHGTELISSFSRKDANALAPISASGNELFPTLSWNEARLKTQYKELLTSYVPMLRYLGQEKFYQPTLDLSQVLTQKVTDNMVVPLLGADDYEISFDYFGWEPYFKTNSEDGMIRPDHMFINYEIINFGSQQYETHYDISYPVLVTIKDSAAFDAQGFNFVFAMESNIRNNAPAIADEVREFYPSREKGILCEENQRSSAPIRAVIVDSFTKEPIEAVNYGFTIPQDESCQLGLTKSRGEIEEKLPQVYGGVLDFSQLNYLGAHYPIDTYTINEPTLIGSAVAGLDTNNKVIELNKIVPINVTIKKKDINKCIKPLICEYVYSGAFTSLIPYKDITCKISGREICTGYEDLFGSNDPAFVVQANGSFSKINNFYQSQGINNLDENQKIVLTLNRVGGFDSNVVEDPFSTSIEITNSDEPMQIDLVPGRYALNAYGVIDELYAIPTEKRCYSYDILTYEKEECYNIDNQTFNQIITTQIIWDTPQTYIEISPDQLYTSDLITFLIPSINFKNLPPKVNSIQKECGGAACVPGIGCAFEACQNVDTPINARIIEDLSALSLMQKAYGNITLRSQFDPIFS